MIWMILGKADIEYWQTRQESDSKVILAYSSCIRLKIMLVLASYLNYMATWQYLKTQERPGKHMALQ